MGHVSDEARVLHAEHPAIDLHADSLMWTRWLGYDLLKRHNAPLPRAAFGGHVDVPRMREGGMGAQFFGLVSLPVLSKRARGLARAVDEQIDAMEETIARRPSEIALCKTAKDVIAAEKRGAVAALLGIEGAHALEGDIDKLTGFAARGVRYLGLLHFSANETGFPAYGRGRQDDQGLTAFGHTVVEKCEELGVLVDLAHVNKRGYLDACAISKKPPIVSHTGVLGAFDHWRNIDDDQLRAIADKGGCVGVIFCPRYLGGDGLEPVVRHMKHIISVVGEDAVALGSDWDGFIVPTNALPDPSHLPELTTAMLEGGIAPSAVGKALRDNVMRVLSS